MPLLLHRWHLDASGAKPQVECRQLVDTVIVPIFQDAGVLGRAESLYAGKYWGRNEPSEVRLTLICESPIATDATRLVEDHLQGQRVSNHVGPCPGDPLCRARAEWYRGRLMDVTRVALDLHRNLAHRDALLRMWTPTDNVALDSYFTTHSATYRMLCKTDETRTAFWRDFWRPGPEPGLSHPAHWIENLVLTE